MLTIEALREYGANVDEGLARCFNNADFYLKLVGMLGNEKGFDKLEEALGKNDLDAAFEAAHALKGVLGNLSLTPAYTQVSEITELLRSRTNMDYSERLAGIMEQQKILKELLN